MVASINRYIAGLLHGGAIGLVVGWFLNSGYAFRGSVEGRLIFPAAIVMVITGHRLNRLAFDVGYRCGARDFKGHTCSNHTFGF